MRQGYSFNIEQGTYHVRAVLAACGALTQDSVVVGEATTQDLVFPPEIEFAGTLPDAAGYSGVENGDENGVIHNWCEISPSNGGHGTATNQTNNTSVARALPFTFRFYGVNFTQVYITLLGEFGGCTIGIENALGTIGQPPNFCRLIH